MEYTNHKNMIRKINMITEVQSEYYTCTECKTRLELFHFDETLYLPYCYICMEYGEKIEVKSKLSRDIKLSSKIVD